MSGDSKVWLILCGKNDKKQIYVKKWKFVFYIKNSKNFTWYDDIKSTVVFTFYTM